MRPVGVQERIHGGDGRKRSTLSIIAQMEQCRRDFQDAVDGASATLTELSLMHSRCVFFNERRGSSDRRRVAAVAALPAE